MSKINPDELDRYITGNYGEDTVTSDTEIDDEEVQCTFCNRMVDLYAEEIYSFYDHDISRTNYVCKECN